MNACSAALIAFALVATQLGPAARHDARVGGDTRAAVIALDSVPSNAGRTVKRADGCRLDVCRWLQRSIATPPTAFALPVADRTVLVVETAFSISHAPARRCHLPQSRAPPVG